MSRFISAGRLAIIYKPSGVYEKLLPSLIVSGPVKCNQANQTVKKCNETSFVALFRMQIYEGDKNSWRKKKVNRLQYNKVGESNDHIFGSFRCQICKGENDINLKEENKY